MSQPAGPLAQPPTETWVPARPLLGARHGSKVGKIRQDLPRRRCPAALRRHRTQGEHCRTMLEAQPDIGFFEVRAENYMAAGGPNRYLSAIRDWCLLSLHWVGLSIGFDRPLDKDHLH
jgi:Protein of unknown function (DUF692)